VISLENNSNLKHASTILLIAVAVILYIFVLSFFSITSNVKGTITQPSQVTVIQVSRITSSPCSYSSQCNILSVQVVNPVTTIVSLTYAVIADNSGNKIGTSSLALTISSQQNTSITVSTISLTSNQRYTITLFGVESVGNSYSSNPAIFTTPY